jgi:release factor glutamine methyltransferase
VATIQAILDKYRPKIDNLDLELLIAHELKKTREFVLAHPEFHISPLKIESLKLKISRRRHSEPLAYILGYKEFYGLDFKVTRDTLIPRPETELLIEKALEKIEALQADRKSLTVIDVGTGSGNIIISLAKNLKNKKINYFGIDISKEALEVATCNAKKHNQKKIKFIQSNLLNSFLENKKNFLSNHEYIILANLPYLSNKIYSASLPTVKNFEPKSALYSSIAGLGHYKKLFEQIKKLSKRYKFSAILLEFSPEQKKELNILVKKILPLSKIQFQKDLAGKWRICILTLI